MKPLAMTVGELKKVLSDHDENLIVVILRAGKGHYHFLDPADIEVLQKDEVYYPGPIPSNHGPSLLIGVV